jgi:hypothetical protein
MGSLLVEDELRKMVDEADRYDLAIRDIMRARAAMIDSLKDGVKGAERTVDLRTIVADPPNIVLLPRRGHRNSEIAHPEIDSDSGRGQVRLLLDKRVGDAVTFAFTAGAVRSA